MPLHGIGLGIKLKFFFEFTFTSEFFNYRSGTVNSKSFIGKVLLRIKQKFELTYAQ